MTEEDEITLAFKAIAEGYPYKIDFENSFVIVENSNFRPDNGEDPNYLILLDRRKYTQKTPQWGSTEWRNNIMETITRRTNELVAKGPEACRNELMKLGFWNEDGTLKDEFKN